MGRKKLASKNENKIDKIKLLFLFLLPVYIICISFYFLPIELKKLFVLIPSSPNIFSIYFSNFLHIDLNHLLGNLFIYTLTILFIILIEKNLKIFCYVSFANFFILPFILSLSSLVYFNLVGFSNIEIVGFSGIISAFLGYFLVSFSKYLFYIYENKIVENLKIIITSVFFISLNATIFILFFTPFYMNNVYLYSLLTLSIFGTLFSFFILRKDFIKIFKNLYFHFLSRIYNQTNFMTALIFSLRTMCFFIVSMSLVFSLPFLITFNLSSRYYINILSHYFGYVFGFFTYLIFQILLSGYKLK